MKLSGRSVGRRIAAGLLGAAFIAGAGSVEAGPAGGGGAPTGTPVTVVLQWQHQAQFAGQYMAVAKGLYERQGLSVKILRGGPDVQPVELMRAGKADFAVLMLSTALRQRAQGVPLMHLAQVVNRSNFLLIAWRYPSAGNSIRTLEDLNGRKVTIWEADLRAPYLAMFGANRVEPVILPQYNTFSLFLHRGADAFAGMRYNEYHSLLQGGVLENEVVAFALSDHGGNLPEDGLYCLGDTWQRRPEVCRAFARASMEGWDYAREHEEETLDVVMDMITRDQRATNRPHMRWMLKEMIASIFPAAGSDWKEGRLSREAYDRAVGILTKHAGLKQAPRYEDIVVGEVTDEIR